MFWKTAITRTILSLSMTVLPPLLNPQSDEGQPLRASVQIVQQKYCRADADLFTVSLKLRVNVSNPSSSPVQIPSKLVPYIAKVFSNMADAGAGRVLYEITQSHYPQDGRDLGTTNIIAGKAFVLQTGYDFIARYRTTFSYPQSLSTGEFAVILVLKPEFKSNKWGPSTSVLDSLTTEPFLVQIDKNPKVVSCD